jgi:hypothetical protein
VDIYCCWFCDFETTDEKKAIKHYKKCFKEFFLKQGLDIETGKPVPRNS